MRALCKAPLQALEASLMGYYTKSKYRGDYYFRPAKGDWYGARGDLWDDITGALGQGADYVKSAWGSLFPPSLGGTKGLPPPDFAATTLINQPTGGTPPPSFTAASRALTINRPGSAAPIMPISPDMGGAPGPNYHWRAPYMVAGAWVGPRHMNPLNPRALKRALRRAGRFRHLCGKVLRLTGEKRHIKGFKGLTSAGYKVHRKSKKVA
jgi:hypothetical protein